MNLAPFQRGPASARRTATLPGARIPTGAVASPGCHLSRLQTLTGSLRGASLLWRGCVLLCFTTPHHKVQWPSSFSTNLTSDTLPWRFREPPRASLPGTGSSTIQAQLNLARADLTGASSHIKCWRGTLTLEATSVKAAPLPACLVEENAPDMHLTFYTIWCFVYAIFSIEYYSKVF